MTPPGRQPIEQHTLDLNIAAKAFTDAVADGNYQHAKNMLATLVRVSTQAYELCHRLDSQSKSDRTLR
jgi:hypothetical protein